MQAAGAPGFGPDTKLQVEVDPTEDTEWNDILRSHGIIPERARTSPTPEEQNAVLAAVDAAAKKVSLDDKSDSELDDLENDLGGEEQKFVEEYRRKRMAELSGLQAQLRSHTFGSVVPISKPDYQSEVTDASASIFIFVHLSLPAGCPQSTLLASLFRVLAPRFPELKFVDIPAARAIENYPDRNCPTLLVYHKKDVVKQYVTLALLGGMGTTLEDVERVLTTVGAVKEDDRRLSSVVKARARRRRAAGRADEVYDDDDDQTRESDDDDDDFE
ncbi:thioredoxin-like protein [Limtongia smithiae]|uniref:thioredoxin-like protein n=1 Tax=Limtongia smithiae TaxID=1125753 RepID=UPI0034CF4505